MEFRKSFIGTCCLYVCRKKIYLKNGEIGHQQRKDKPRFREAQQEKRRHHSILDNGMVPEKRRQKSARSPSFLVYNKEVSNDKDLWQKSNGVGLNEVHERLEKLATNKSTSGGTFSEVGQLSSLENYENEQSMDASRFNRLENEKEARRSSSFIPSGVQDTPLTSVNGETCTSVRSFKNTQPNSSSARRKRNSITYPKRRKSKVMNNDEMKLHHDARQGFSNDEENEGMLYKEEL